jgi:glycerophosphoryl diester phosphodiesterase
MNAHAGERQIFFSSFDPFVCATLALRQSRWPVFQLFNCKKRWNGCSVMASKARALVPLHKELGVHGFVFDGDHLLEVPELIPKLRDQEFVICTYGGINNSAEGIKKQLQLGVSGICTDDMTLCRSVIDEYLQNC